jgi:trehalose synthase
LLQKSLREGFALTVTEALWKQKPVVASAIGGIPLQVIHRFSGLLSHSIDTAALAVRHLLANPALGVQLGKNAKEHVRNNFLITRHMREHMLLFQALRKQGDILTL